MLDSPILGFERSLGQVLVHLAIRPKLEFVVPFTGLFLDDVALCACTHFVASLVILIGGKLSNLSLASVIAGLLLNLQSAGFPVFFGLLDSFQ
jgi:hypothetical protein